MTFPDSVIRFKVPELYIAEPATPSLFSKIEFEMLAVALRFVIVPNEFSVIFATKYESEMFITPFSALQIVPL